MPPVVYQYLPIKVWKIEGNLRRFACEQEVLPHYGELCKLLVSAAAFVRCIRSWD